MKRHRHRNLTTARFEKAAGMPDIVRPLASIRKIIERKLTKFLVGTAILMSNMAIASPLHLGKEYDRHLPQANFSGIWEYSSKFAINESGIVTHRIALSQVGNHICGCFIREWSHENFYEFNSLGGRVTGIIADISIDKGFSGNGQASYKIKYPFTPQDVMRLKKIDNSLSRAIINDSENFIKDGLPSDDEVIYDDERFLKFIAPFSLSACQQEEFDWSSFFASCSADK